jgi:methylmalonyl-CoA mutase cobalamin-binding subunit
MSGAILRLIPTARSAFLAISELKRLGVAGVFTPGATTESIIEFIRAAVPSARWGDRAHG